MESLLTVVPDITARHKESGGYRCPKACDFPFRMPKDRSSLMSAHLFRALHRNWVTAGKVLGSAVTPVHTGHVFS